ncbi:MAG: trypsin-like peptidase domain-containing protein [Gemmataceae bacterium]
MAKLCGLTFIFLMVFHANAVVFAQSPLNQIQKDVQKAASKAEKSIACILVSRSSRYKEMGAVPPVDIPGRLGGFQPIQPQVRRFRNVPDRSQAGLDLADPDTVPDSFGSGVLIDKNLVLTTAHVVRGAVKIYVRFPGNKGSYADIHALDGRSDLAMLRLIDFVDDLNPLPFSEEGISRGQFVIHLSNGYGSGFKDGSPAIGWGMVSNLRRKWTSRDVDAERNQIPLYQYGTLIQLDSPVRAGASGGVVLNMDGAWLGMLTTSAGWPGLDFAGGFAIPMDPNYRRLVEVLKKGQEIDYGFLGVQIDPVGTGGNGVLIQNVTGNTPAAMAGMNRGERIISIQGQRLETQEDLFFYTGTSLAGSEVTLEIAGVAGAPNRFIKARLAKYLSTSDIIASTQPEAPFGIRVDYTSLLAQRPFGLNPWNRGIPLGVLIKEIVPGSSAEVAKLQPGKVISRIGNKSLVTPEDFYNAMKVAGNKVGITVTQTDGSEEQIELAR